MDKRTRQRRVLTWLCKLYAKVDLTWFLQDIRYCLLYMGMDLICLFVSMTGIFLLSARFGGSGSMTETEVLFIPGYSTLADGIYMTFFMGNNTSMVGRVIGQGQLGHMVIQSVPTWVHLLCQRFSSVSANPTLLCGISITGFALRRLPVAVTPLFLLAAAPNALASCLILMMVIYLISCLTSYAPAAVEEIAQSGLNPFTVETYLLSELEGRVKLFFCTAVPVGMGIWFPNRAPLQLGYGHGHSVNAIATTLSLVAVPALAMLLATLTLMTFKKGTNHYEIDGSPRHSGFDHR